MGIDDLVSRPGFKYLKKVVNGTSLSPSNSAKQKGFSNGDTVQIFQKPVKKTRLMFPLYQDTVLQSFFG
jgi:hypothetical protein